MLLWLLLNIVRINVETPFPYVNKRFGEVIIIFSNVYFFGFVNRFHFFMKFISDRNIPQSFKKLYRRSNEVVSDLKSLSRNVKSQLFSTFCLDA